jgi:hypothetical protein
VPSRRPITNPLSTSVSNYPGRLLSLPATRSIRQPTSRAAEEAVWRKWREVPCEDFQYLLGFLVALNLPRTTVEGEDLSDVNRRQRRLMRKPRQEYHLVRINVDDIDLIYRSNREGHHSLRGEHDVRGFYRHLRSGRVSWVRPHKRGNGPTKTRRAGYELIPPVPPPDVAINARNRN